MSLRSVVDTSWQPRLLTLNRVSVHVLTDGDARMAQHLRDDVDVRALGQHQEAPECRSSCRCQWPRPARRQMRENTCETLSGSRRLAALGAGCGPVLAALRSGPRPSTGTGCPSGRWHAMEHSRATTLLGRADLKARLPLQPAHVVAWTGALGRRPMVLIAFEPAPTAIRVPIVLAVHAHLVRSSPDSCQRRNPVRADADSRRAFVRPQPPSDSGGQSRRKPSWTLPRGLGKRAPQPEARC